MSHMCHLVAISLGWLFATTAWAQDSTDALRGEALSALRRAVEFFRTRVSAEGGYLYQYSADLSRREGEGVAKASTAWIQPPGTPAVGEVYLTAWRATGDRYYLEAARETAEALLRGQLESGGWDNLIEFDPPDRRRYAYRVDGGPLGKRRNTSTLDDNKTQSAVRFLMHVDEAFEQKDAKVHEAVAYALDRLVQIQYPNGAWPQRFSGPPDPDQHPVLRASYPESWPREFPSRNYANYYTFNDNTIADCIDVMFEAAHRYQEPRYRQAAEKAGEFILLAQMPEPQPAWAQQYNTQMQPDWARKFEPPAVTGGESQGVLRALLRLYRETADTKYLEPIPRALAWLQKSRLPEGRLARFYELRTNRPLYFTKDYQLTYSDADMPTHYGFKVSDNTDAIAREYERLKSLSPDVLAAESKAAHTTPAPRRGKPSSSLVKQTRQVIEALDQQGRWLETGRLRYHNDAPEEPIISSRTFIDRVTTLSRFLGATGPGE